MILFAFGLYSGNVLCGVCSFGISANQHLNKIGEYSILELNRLVVNDSVKKGALSFFVSKCLKMLPTPYIVVSYADPNNGHTGFIYQATNFLYTGKTTVSAVYKKGGKEYHGKSFSNKFGRRDRKFAEENGFKVVTKMAKHRYFYFIGSKKQKKDMLAKLPFKVLPYPKGQNTRYDTSYEVRTQLTLL